MKRIGVLAGVCLAALMTRCALPLGDDFLTPELRGLTIGNDSSIIVDYNLQNYVPVPVEGEMPVVSITTRTDMEGTVVWSQETGTGNFEPITDATFQIGKVYRARINLTTKNNWTFNPEISFMYPNNTIRVQPDANTESLSRALSPVTYNSTMKAQLIGDLDLSPYVPAPVKDFIPVRFFSGPQYTGTVNWKVTDGLSLADIFQSGFQAGVKYTAIVTLNAAPGYVFGTEKFYHTGDSIGGTEPPGNLDFIRNSASTGTVTMLFPETQLSGFVLSFGPVNTANTALAWINQEKARYADDPLEITLPSGEEEIQGVKFTRGDNSPAEVIINGAGRILRPEAGASGEPLLTVGNDVTLILRDIVLQGGSSRSAPLIRVESGGMLILDSGALLTKNTNTRSASGGGVVVASGGKLEMKGNAKISENVVTANNSGGGVYIAPGGEFTLGSGSIMGNFLSIDTLEGRPLGNYAGGVYIASGGLFTMNGGSIEKNKAGSSTEVGIFAGRGFVGSAGVFVQGELTLRGGSIAYNDGLFLNGGVWVEGGVFIMEGGIIEHNTCDDVYSGGVWVKEGTFTQRGGVITNNTDRSSVNP